MHRGYTKRWRKRWDKGYHQDLLLFVMMDYFIDFATWKDKEFAFAWKGKIVEMVKTKRGQCFFTFKQLANFLTGPKNKVSRKMIRERVKILQKIGFLEHKQGHQYQVVTILNYDKYNPTDEEAAHQPAHQPTINRPSIDHQSTTSKNYNNNNNRNRPGSDPDYQTIITGAIEYLNQLAGVNFKPTTYATETIMVDRINEGATLDDFKKVIKKKTSQWLNDERMAGNLAPTTLFASDKFEKYLQETNRNDGSKKPKIPKLTGNQLLALGFDILDKFGRDKFDEFCLQNELSQNDITIIQEKYDRESAAK